MMTGIARSDGIATGKEAIVIENTTGTDIEEKKTSQETENVTESATEIATGTWSDVTEIGATETAVRHILEDAKTTTTANTTESLSEAEEKTAAEGKRGFKAHRETRHHPIIRRRLVLQRVYYLKNPQRSPLLLHHHRQRLRFPRLRFKYG